MRVCFVIMAVFAYMLVSDVNAYADGQAAEVAKQGQAKEVFANFIDRFANNVEPVDAQLVVDCISIYNDAFKHPGFSSEQLFDLLGSKSGWELAAAAKTSKGEELPVSRFFVADDTQTIPAEMRSELLEGLGECRRNEERAHAAALQGSTVK